jgi:hypothetical protein
VTLKERFVATDTQNITDELFEVAVSVRFAHEFKRFRSGVEPFIRKRVQCSAVDC